MFLWRCWPVGIPVIVVAIDRVAGRRTTGKGRDAFRPGPASGLIGLRRKDETQEVCSLCGTCKKSNHLEPDCYFKNVEESKGDQEEKKKVCFLTENNGTKQWILDSRTTSHMVMNFQPNVGHVFECGKQNSRKKLEVSMDERIKMDIIFENLQWPLRCGLKEARLCSTMDCGYVCCSGNEAPPSPPSATEALLPVRLCRLNVFSVVPMHVITCQRRDTVDVSVKCGVTGVLPRISIRQFVPEADHFADTSNTNTAGSGRSRANVSSPMSGITNIYDGMLGFESECKGTLLEQGESRRYRGQ
ncbi:hypothetical protein WN48_05214 [Eufriesea mexicana]|uniref:Uncharacterized protein n=1 Tax=Eufriesea mexicana TaxID=516756 RepID=A0A310SLC8_9HYME|nr:hypothetical protein WN48_05214 [Eufriesea mexicana]